MDFVILVNGYSVPATTNYSPGNDRVLISISQNGFEYGRNVTIQASSLNTITDYNENRLDFTSQTITVQK